MERTESTMGRRNRVLVISIVLLLLVIRPVTAPTTPPVGSEVPSEPGVIYQDDINTTRPNRIAVIEVEGRGIIRIELYDNMTPITTENFVKLAESGFYDGIKFHRCIDDFVAQTGDPNTLDNNLYNDGWGGSGETIPLEIHHNATHVDGAVGMARESEPDTASSQFYICDGPQHGLDDEQRMQDSGEHGYAVFGVVIEGLEIAKAIAACETYGNMRPLLKDHPVEDIVMTQVTIENGLFPNATDNGSGESGGNGDSTRKKMDSGIDRILFIFGIILLIGIVVWVVVVRRRK